MPLPTHKRILCGMPIGIVLMCWHSLTLGIDYSMWISTAPAYFSDILNHSGDYGSTTNDTALLLDDATAAFSVAQSVWAAGQLTGCMAAAPLPRLLGFRWSFVLLVFLSCFGSVMYSVAGIIGGEGGQWLAWVGKALDGFGDGSVALGLSYIPITLFHDRKKMVSAMINYRMLMAFGMFLGGAVSLGLDNIDITQAVGSDGLAREFSGGDLVGWAMGIIYFPSVFLACCALDNQKPPVAKGKNGKGGAPCTPYFTQKSIFWLFLVFSYGLTGSLATYFLPVFPYCPGYCNSMASLADLSIGQYIGIVTVGAFFCGFLGALFNSVVSYVKRCNIGGLPILRADCILITTSIGLMYAGYRTFDTTASEVESSQLMFIAGVCLYFLASTSLSAGMAPVFKEVIPKPSLSAMMPLYKICLDGGKIVGPLYSDWASTESSDEWATRADVAFIPSILMYILISLAIFVAGKYLSTPDFKPGRGGPGHRPNDNPHVAAASKEEPKKTAEMTAFASGSGGGGGGDRPEVNSYENQGVGSSGHIRQTKASTSGYDLYSGTSMSYSQIADAKNIDSVKVSLVI